MTDKPTLKLKNMQTSISHDVLGSNGAMAFYWHSNSEIYIQKNVNNKCVINKLSQTEVNVFSIDPKFKLDCGLYTNYAGIDGDNKDWIYYTSKKTVNTPFNLYRYHLKSSISEQLTAPSYSSIGDYSVSLSPNNDMLAFSRSNSSSSKSIGLLDINTREVKLLVDTSTPIFGVSWFDNNHLLYSDKKLLKKIDIKTKINSTIYKTDKIIRLPSVQDGEILVSKGKLFVTNIRSYNINNGDSKYLSNTQFLNSRWAINPNPALDEEAFFTDQSGLPQLWIKHGNKLTKQVTEFRNRNSLSELRYSPDGQTVSFLKNGTLQLYSLATDKLSSLDGHLVNSTSWDCSTGRLLSVIKQPESTRSSLFEIDADLTMKHIIDDINTIKHDCSSLINYASLPHISGIYNFNKSTLALVQVYDTKEILIKSESWAVYENAIFINQEDKLFKYNLLSNISSEIFMKGLTSTGFSISQGFIIYPDRKLGNTTISKLAI